ncbi:MAG: hypothetical protein NC203_03770 [Firmicutes bacterium]|nr:hypothetical protein [[Eubacterium] siraeum]MCM1487465.1 hypothetical protein [Bacillota bacterium]
MSLKSFDKFCENMILGPEKYDYRQKEIYDERQNQVRQKLITEALLVYCGAVFVNTVVMENIYQWCSSYLAPIIFLAMVCYFYWMLRCKAMGCLFGVGSSYNTKWTGWILIIESIMFELLCIDDITAALGEGKSFFFNDGMVEANFLLSLVFPLISTVGIITVVLAKKHIRETEGEKEENSPKK